MIDPTTEQLLRLEDIARLVPAGRGNRGTHRSTVLRWVLRGSRAPDGSRVRLEAVRLGGKWLSSATALRRFLQALTPTLDTDADGTRAWPRSAGVRARAADRAMATLGRMGI